MSKKFTIILILLGVLAIGAFLGLGIWRSTSMTPSFEDGGYVLQAKDGTVQSFVFDSGTEYVSDIAGSISFVDSNGERRSIERQSFVFFNNRSVEALQDGVLLDFDDLSENFINNYYIRAGIAIAESGGSYSAETETGEMNFGENIWKMSEGYYLVQSPTLNVYFSDSDIRAVEEYVLVQVTGDGVVNLITRDALWMTISEACYIETAGGVRIYPVSQLVVNDEYKLSLAKLAVSPEDAIVLSEAETRRQIVPELNIETIDGEDGEDGADGEAGEDGEAGVDGEDGVSGTDGEDGVSGTDGDNGEGGVQGLGGGGGADGSDGKGGDVGGGGNGGTPGNKGSDGKNAVVESSTNSALPTITIGNWQVSSDSLKGSLLVTDTAEFFNAITELSDYRSNYPAKVTITNVKTGKVIDCYQTTDKYNADSGDLVFDDIYNGQAEVYFSTKDGPLEPDTEYRLSVTAYYKAQDETGMVYSREFLTRTFCTDSSGVSLRYVQATTNTVTVAADVHPEKKAVISGAKVYLLTPEQNEKFTAASVDKRENYVEMLSAINADGSVNTLVFGADPNVTLTPDTEYIARVIVDATGLTILSAQELEVKTLKRVPTIQDGAKPTVTYNRVTGSFEVWRPVVTDLDSGVKSYIYSAYYYDAEGKPVKVSSRAVSPTASEPIEFQLEAEKDYCFGVNLEFFDNEKTVYYDLGLSDTIRTDGDTLPRMNLHNIVNHEYNHYEATLRINLASANTHMEVDGSHPLHLELLADQVQNSKLTLTSMGTNVYVGSADKTASDYQGYVQLLQTPQSSNYLDISLNLDNLKKNTTYTLTVYGYIDLGDGNGPTYRALGTVSLMTKNVVALGVEWSQPTEEVTTSFARTLRLAVQDSEADTVRTNYALAELKKGEITAELYSGTGVGMLLIREAVISDPDTLAEIYSDKGYQLTELDFGNVTLDANGTYTLRIESIVDSSATMMLGYENEYDRVTQSPEVVAAEPTPPDLLQDPSQGVEAKPILNSEAPDFGLTMDENMPADTVIGYTLTSSYKNDQRIGRSITYYAYELNAFYNALNNNLDPIVSSQPLMKMTQGIDDSSDTVPNVAVIFGGSKTADADAQLSNNGYYIYYTGTASYPAGALDSGMGRGFRYIFAYTVEYVASTAVETGSTRTYPYEHKQYRSFVASRGGVTHNGVTVGNGVAYILHSGVVELPFMMPEFHSYVYSSDQSLETGGGWTSGKVELHYTWDDPDGMVVTIDNKETIIRFKEAGGNGDAEQAINEYPVENSGWYKVTLPYMVTQTTAATELLEPMVILSQYAINYSAALNTFGLPEDSGSYPLASIPVEYDWKGTLDALTDAERRITIKVKEEENCIDFIIDNVTAAGLIRQRASGMQITMQVLNQPETSTTFLLGLSNDSSTYARMATGLLPAAFIGKTFEVTEARIVYDTGEQGWALAEEKEKYADDLWYASHIGDQTGKDVRKPIMLQYTNSSDTAAGFMFSNYVLGNGTTDIPANCAVFLPYDTAETSFSVADLRNAVARAKQEGVDAKARLYADILSGTSVNSVRYLYPSHYGVDVHTERSMESLSKRYAVPKAVDTMMLEFAIDAYGNKDNTGTVSNVTPTVAVTNFPATSDSLSINGMTISGFGAGGGTVYARAYTDRDLAEELSSSYDSDEITITIDANGRPSTWTGMDKEENKEYPTLSVTGSGSLEQGRRYYVVFYYKDGNGHDVVLLRSDNAEKAIFNAMTSAGVGFTVTENIYYNSSYNDKFVDVKFDMTRAFNLTVRYDLYATAEEAASDNGTPLMSYEELRGYASAEEMTQAGNAANEKTILSIPTELDYYDNALRLNLTPSALRTKLQPGRTYFLKFSAYETGNVFAGSQVEPITLDPVGNYGALVTIASAKAESVEFEVTINDPQYSYMASSDKEGSAAGGYYAVRFVDQHGKRLHTIYDNKLYRAVSYDADGMPQLKRRFVLNDENLTMKASLPGQDIQADQAYSILIYAVPDTDHNGTVVLSGDATNTPQGVDYFFGGYDESQEKATCNFQLALDTFWDGSGNNVEAMDNGLERQLLVAQKTQSTTSETGWLLNTTRIYSERVNSTKVRVVLDESFGLIDESATPPEPVFKRIDWMVSGSTGGKPVLETRTELYSEQDVLLQRAESAGGTNIYYFEIPIDVLRGSYDITIQFRKNEGDPVAYESITVFCS